MTDMLVNRDNNELVQRIAAQDENSDGPKMCEKK